MKANRSYKMEDEAVSAVIGVILMVAITVAIAATVYVYVSGMMGAPTASAPKISWVPNAAENSITITKGATGFNYAAGSASTDANLVFRLSGTTTNLYVNTSMGVSAAGTPYEEEIQAGDILTFGAEGTYTLIWLPTDEVLGTVSV